MPEDNKDAYKEMYDMGSRLMAMAKEGGYDPEESSEDMEDGDYDDAPMEADAQPVSSGTKMNSAMKIFANG